MAVRAKDLTSGEIPWALRSLSHLGELPLAQGSETESCRAHQNLDNQPCLEEAGAPPGSKSCGPSSTSASTPSLHSTITALDRR